MIRRFEGGGHVVNLDLDKYKCRACPYIYDPAVGDPTQGIAPGTAFEDLPEDWLCPECFVSKAMFDKI
jgi:rubredoxin